MRKLSGLEHQIKAAAPVSERAVLTRPRFGTRLLLALARNTPLGRGGARRRVLSLLERLHSGPIETTFRGVPICLHLDNTTERKALLCSYDQRELDFLSRFLTAAPSNFADVGSNAGLYTQYLAARMKPGSKIVAVEPNPEMCGRIGVNLRLLEGHTGGRQVAISVEQCAAGEEAGSARLQTSGGLGAAYLLDSHAASGIEVAVRPLIEILQANGITVLHGMKIDVEGYEDRVLMPFFAGAPHSLYPRALVLEHTHRSRWNVDVISRCLELGYREEGRTRGNLFLVLPQPAAAFAR